MAGPAIEVERLHKSYPIARRGGDLFRALIRQRISHADDKPALVDVNLCVAKGDSLAVIGRNGSGKTTLLRILAAILRPTGGSVRVHGRAAGLLDLSAGIDPEFSGAENAVLLGVLAGASRTETRRRLGAIRDFSGLGEAFDDPVRSYSSGMALRLAFSAAVHSEPEVLLIDEVLAVGDAFFQQRCLRRIRKLQSTGCTTVLVTHDPSAAISFCNSAIWLERGHIASTGDPAKVVREYMGARYRNAAALEEDFEFDPRAAELATSGELEPADSVPNVDHRYGDGRARIEGVAVRGIDGRPLAEPRPGEEVRVVISVACEQALPAPVVGFSLRNRLGEIVSATNTASEGWALPELRPGERMTVEFGWRWPRFVSGMFSISPAIANGVLEQHEMNDWIDNAIVLETVNPEARYGWIQLENVKVRCSRQGEPRE